MRRTFRETACATVAIDFEIATAMQIPTARGQAMVKCMEVCRHEGQILRQIWKQMAMLGGIEEMTELLTEQAPDLMFVGLPNVVDFATGANFRCETKVAEYVTKWLQEKGSIRKRTPHASGRTMPDGS